MIASIWGPHYADSVLGFPVSASNLNNHVSLLFFVSGFIFSLFLTNSTSQFMGKNSRI